MVSHIALSSALSVLLVTCQLCAQPESSPPVPPPYQIQPGDELSIRALNMPDLEQNVVVRPDGRISLLLLNEIQASGQTVSALSDELTAEYAKHFREPHIAVIVESFANRNVFVGGEVNNPGMVPLTGVTTALAAIFRAGGYKESARQTEILLIRGSTQRKLNLEQALEGGKDDIQLEPADVLFVPKSVINVYVGGEVARPGLQPLLGRMTPLQAIVQAGGLKPTARAKKIVLIRDSGQQPPTVMAVNLADAVNGKAEAVLKPFDVVFVPRTPIAKVDNFIDQYIRQLLPISLNGGFTYLIGKGVVF
jgi:polysaccharide export outer membrane protein